MKDCHEPSARVGHDDDTLDSVPPPESIGAYRIRGRLGSGGMGEVFLAYDDRLRRHVAVKRLRHDVETTPDRRRRFRREARAAAGLNHPSIVQIHDILEDDAGDSIVMEYVEGRSLERLLARDGVGVADAVNLARQVAEGLVAAHDRGIVHRDLKAENVMLTPEGRVKILDFGLAKPPPFTEPDDALTQEGAVLGTLRVMAPEQAAGRRVDARSDLYSLGVLLYEMLTGRPPFEGEGIPFVLEQVLNARAVAPIHLRPELPPALSSLVEALLEKDPDRRPQSAREVVALLSEIEESSSMARLGARPRLPSREAPAADSDAPTLMPTPQVTPRPMPVASVPAAPAASLQGMVRLRTVLIGLALAAVLCATLYLFLSEPKPLRVLVLPPEVTDGSTGTELAQTGLGEATTSTLLSLRGLEPVDSNASGDGPRSYTEMALAAAADEIVASTLDLRDGALWVTLRRIDGADDRVLWTSGPIELSARPQDSRILSDVITSRLREAYPERRLRPGATRLEVADQDYAAYLELHRRVLAGESLGPSELAELEGIMASSPRFPEAYLLAANVARTADRFDHARDILDRAAKIAPNDPRPVFQLVRLELDMKRFDDAEATIRELERRAPGDLGAAFCRARLLGGRGQLREAVAAWKELVAVRPSWLYLYHLARAQVDLGEIDEARNNLSRLLSVSPRNSWGLAQLSALELRHGRLEEAETLYRDLAELRPDRPVLSNLATVLYLRGRYAEAVATYRRALELNPGYLLTRVNLADAELETGNEEVARALYEGVVDELRDQEHAHGEQAGDSMILAQCLARLGEAGPAVEITQRTLQLHPDSSDVVYLAAVVYALAGERHSALASAEEASRRGYQPHFFQISAFDALKSEPRFKAILSSEGGPH